MMPIKFGTDGWRGEIGIDFTLTNVDRAIKAIGKYFQEKVKGEALLLVGYDTRFQARRFAHFCAEELASLGHRVLLADKAITTPVLSHAIRYYLAAGGIMLTASHNPAEWLGIKIKNHYGASASITDTIRIEALLDTDCRPIGKGCCQLADFDEIYLQNIRRRFPSLFTQETDGTILVDCLYGAGQGYFPRLLRDSGWQVIELHAEVNPAFGGKTPEPIAANLFDLQQAVIEYRTAGMAFDGDGDRIGMVLENGDIITAQEIFLLLLYHLAQNKKQRGKVIKTFSTSAKVDVLASKYNLELTITPIGFKHIAPLLINDQQVLLGGEESGGFGFPDFLPERDGIYAAINLLDLRRSGSFTDLLTQLKDILGPWHYRRLDLPCDVERKQHWQQKLTAIPPVLGEKISRLESMDGIKLHFSSGAWLLFRFSGTEPLLRLYCEGESETAVDFLLDAALAWLNS